MSEAKDKVIALAERYDALKAQVEAKIVEGGSAPAQGTRMVALLILRQFNLMEVLSDCAKAADWEPITPDQAAHEAEAEGSLGAALERYSASLTGRPQPIISHAGFVRAWEAQTGTTGDAIDPYFGGIVEHVLPLAESIINRAEELLEQSDSMPAA